MPNLNRVLLAGNLTRDPELRYTPNNTAVVALGIAINRRFKDQTGEQREEVTFVDCDAFGRTAEVINQYMKKGRPIFIEGRLKLDQWQDKEGQKRSKLKVIIENFQFMSENRGQDGDDGGGEDRSSPPQRSAPRSAPRSANPGPPPDTHQPVEEEDIPF